MLITADQLMAHAVGDYVLQSDWMATEKTRRSFAALVHVLSYSLPFLLLRPSLAAWAVIVSTHFAIDRWQLARFVVWSKNQTTNVSFWKGTIGWSIADWRRCSATGYDPDRPAWLSTWLLIIADNILHVAINGAALRWL